MNRRGFLKALAGVAAASTTAYFLAPIGGWSSDVIAHASDDLLFRAEPEWINGVGAAWTTQQLQLEALHRTVQLLIERDDALDRGIIYGEPPRWTSSETPFGCIPHESSTYKFKCRGAGLDPRIVEVEVPRTWLQ